jgi:hypothetical protein
LLVTELAKDPMFTMKSQGEQAKVVEQLLSHIPNGDVSARKGAKANTSTTDNPFTPDPASPASAAKGGLYFRNKKTGEIVQR